MLRRSGCTRRKLVGTLQRTLRDLPLVLYVPRGSKAAHEGCHAWFEGHRWRSELSSTGMRTLCGVDRTVLADLAPSWPLR